MSSFPKAIEEQGRGDEDDVEHSGSSKPATFEGQLKLGDFMFNDSESAPKHSPAPSRSTSSKVSHSTSPSSTPKRKSDALNPKPKKKRTSSSYAPPSTYAHLSPLPDAVLPNLLVFFIGLNPGLQTARTGHTYAHPSNLFWKLLFTSGITPRLLTPQEDRSMPELYSLGFTNIVERPSRNGGELSKGEMDEGVKVLEEKARKWRPECMCIVGKSIWESIWRVRYGKVMGKEFKYGWQDERENMGVIEGEWTGARVFVATSTSGLAASLSPAEKERIWSELGEWVKTRRTEKEINEEKEVFDGFVKLQ